MNDDSESDDTDAACDELAPDVDELRAAVADLRAKREQVFEPRLDTILDRLDDLDQRLAAVEETATEHSQELATICQHDGAGDSTKEQRLVATAAGLVNQARARKHKGDDPVVQWTYSDVVDHLETNGHGSIYPYQAYDLMDELAEWEGFGEAENQDGTRVVRVNVDRVPDPEAVIENHNETGGTPGGRPQNNLAQSNQA